MIETRGLTKRYGSLTALDDLTLEIAPGQVFGFIGPNGAGKTTTMKILSCLIRPDAGQARVCGLDAATDADQIRRLIGYMPDFLGLYEDLTVDEYLQFFASAYGLPRAGRRKTIDEALELTDLAAKKHELVEGLSRGMTQRLGVARVLIHDPKVLLLDEPASGLDPRARIEIRSLLTELARMGKTLMVSSHILSELAEMCSMIGIIEKGRLLYCGSMKDAYERTRSLAGGEKVAVRLEPGGAPAALVRDALLRDARVRGVTAEDASNTLLVELIEGEHGHHFLIELLLGAGARIAGFQPRDIDLEDAFLRLTTGRVQ